MTKSALLPHSLPLIGSLFNLISSLPPYSTSQLPNMQYSLGLIGLLSLLPAIIGNPLPELGMSPVPRQVQLHDPSQECCKVNCHLENVGDGNMHTDWLHTQVTQPIACNEGTCSATYSKTYSVSWTVNAGISAGFFSGGFSVSESWSDGYGYTCSGKDGENVCVWMAVGHAAYTVQPNTHGYPPIYEYPVIRMTH